MTDRTNVAIARVKAVSPEAKVAHCCIYREPVAMKEVLAEISAVLKEFVKTVIFIKAFNSRIFGEACEEVGCDHHQLLLHTKTHWVSRWTVFTRLFQL
jgi:hypothetical protein